MYKNIQQEAEKASLSYFSGDELAARVWSTKYALKDSFGNLYEHTPDEIHKRLANEIARIEEKYANPMSEAEVFDLLRDFSGIMYAGGSRGDDVEYPLETIMNDCFVINKNSENNGSLGLFIIDDEQQTRLKQSKGKFEQIRADSVIAKNYMMSDNMHYMESNTKQQPKTTMERTQKPIDNSRLAHFTQTQRDEIKEWVTDYVDQYYDGYILKKVDNIEERVEKLEKIPESFYRSRKFSYFIEEKARNYRYGRTIEDLNEELRGGFRKKNGMPDFIKKISKWNNDGVLLFKGSGKRDIFDELIFCFYDEGELSEEELKQKWEAFRKASVSWTPK
jgi:hypothetical protein